MKINELKKYRQAKKIPQSMVAEALNISRFQYSRMEQSGIVPDKYVPLLSEILGDEFSLMTPFSPSYLKAMRNLSGLTLKEAAADLGISPQAIRRQESGANTFSYQKYKDTYFHLYKEFLAKKDILPFVVKEVPGASIFFCLDKCFILINDEKIFNIESYIPEPEIEIKIYKLTDTIS